MTEPSPTQRTIEAIWKIESARLTAGLLRMVRDVGIAEEIAQDAFVAALGQWPECGVPRNPGAWLMATAKHRAIDRLRRDRKFRAVREDLGRAGSSEHGGASPDPGIERADMRLDGAVEDDLLRLVFTACHPALSGESRAAITLRLLCGLTTSEIARAFLVPEPTIAQRIVRAKRTLSEHGVPLEAPVGAELAHRLASVLEVVYLLFNEGYAATSGDDWMRPALCEEALRLGRVLAGIIPNEPEVHGLVALMEIQASRKAARLGPAGRPVLLLEQNRALWDQVLIRRGLCALDRARGSGATHGPYTIQASIAACHARARAPDDTDWAEIIGHYEQLSRVAPSPVVELNRAVAVAMALGPRAGLEITDTLVSDPVLGEYHLLPSVRGDFLFKLGRFAEARREFERAASLCRNAPEKGILLERADACVGSVRTPGHEETVNASTRPPGDPGAPASRLTR